jgi:hypothetical protein
MANYLLVCVEPRQTALVEKWFSSAEGKEADLLKLELSEKGRCYYYANRGRLDKTLDGGIFKGYAIDHPRQEILYSGGGGGVTCRAFIGPSPAATSDWNVAQKSL